MTDLSPTDRSGPDCLVNCGRCGALCLFRGDPGLSARLLRRSATPNGLCGNCAVTAWLKGMEPLATIIAERGPAILLTPVVAKQMAGVMAAGSADAKPEEIDWPTVVRQWDLEAPDA